MRSVLYRFPDLRQFEQIVCDPGGGDPELGLPAGEVVTDGEWVLAIFELGENRRATSAAACASVSPEGARLTFEPRDWRRLVHFAQTEATRPGSMPDTDTAALAGAGSAGSAGGKVTAGAAAPPAAPAQAQAAGPADRVAMRPAPPRLRGKGSRVLVVDDDPDIRDMVSTMLEAVELVVVSAASAEEALEHVRGAPFELVVLDWNLPRMTGIDLCRTLRQEPELSDLPVLFLTANASPQDMAHAFASGADDYLVKPFRAPELGARIFSLLRRARRGAP
ncbi:transcriptional regulator [Sorangium cellulosum]|uniref:Transcriptional regulator n=1 Tax=Sorangium cellulosum TaxID=56 RepID=A0A2L0F786_SORCE|nr:response regulator [Sorangium cellulosum]AUX47387.1 transcriptional regulator [Sorangium cellulosum]